VQVIYKQVMKQYNLGPNGGILTSCNLFATRFDQVGVRALTTCLLRALTCWARTRPMRQAPTPLRDCVMYQQRAMLGRNGLQAAYY